MMGRPTFQYASVSTSGLPQVVAIQFSESVQTNLQHTEQFSFKGHRMRTTMVGNEENKTAQALRESARDFCTHTSVHGFSYWVSSGNN